MGANNDTQVHARATESAKRAKQMPEGVQYAITVALPNISNGAFWGFTTVDGVQKHISAIREAAPNIIARKLGNACLIEVNPSYLLQAVQIIDANALTQDDIANINKARAEAHVAFERFLIARGKESAKTGVKWSGTIGIYCTNDVTTISSKGVNYPAFRLNIQDVLGYMANYGYVVKDNGAWVPANQATQSKTLFNSMQLSPTKTGIFVEIACTYSAAQILELEKNYKARMKLS